jgi:hypothetical protein
VIEYCLSDFVMDIVSSGRRLGVRATVFTIIPREDSAQRTTALATPAASGTMTATGIDPREGRMSRKSRSMIHGIKKSCPASRIPATI